MSELLDLIIVGAGPAGLAAALEAARAGLTAVTLERMGAGGQLINLDRIDDCPGFPDGIAGYDLGPRLMEQAMNAGARIEYAEAESMRRDGDHWVVEAGGSFRARAVIIASGGTLTPLRAPGSEAFEGRGISYCATCDAEFYRDQEVAVLGGGDWALQEAAYLAGICARVHIVHPEPELTAVASLQQQARADPRLSFMPAAGIAELRGRETLEALVLRRDGSEVTLPVAGIFVYTGLTPNSGWLGELSLDAEGRIPVDAGMGTAQPGLFAAGDIRAAAPYRIAAALGDGAVAAVAVAGYLRRQKN